MNNQKQLIVFGQLISITDNMMTFGINLKNVLEQIYKFSEKHSLSEDKVSEIVKNAEDNSMRMKSRRKLSNVEVL